MVRVSCANADNNNQGLAAVIKKLTPEQAAQMTAEIIKAKNRIAPDSRGTIIAGHQRDIGSMLEAGHKQTALKEGRRNQCAPEAPGISKPRKKAEPATLKPARRAAG
jgi:hypothetical protein